MERMCEKGNFCDERHCTDELPSFSGTLINGRLKSPPVTLLQRCENKIADYFYAPSDSPPSGGGRSRCSCGHISRMCRGTSSGERVRQFSAKETLHSFLTFIFRANRTTCFLLFPHRLAHISLYSAKACLSLAFHQTPITHLHGVNL
jgi:hypothetical protein